MTSPDLPTAPVRTVSRLRTLLTRLRAHLQGPSLDADLAAGVRPSVSAAHLARADWITGQAARRRVSDALNRALRVADAPPAKGTVYAPLSIPAIRACRDALKQLAVAVVTTENPRVQGIAIAHQLVFDGTGALFFQPTERRPTERLENTIWAALRALSVSGDFDRVPAA
jgi:hypothetical protein